MHVYAPNIAMVMAVIATVMSQSSANLHAHYRKVATSSGTHVVNVVALNLPYRL